MNYAAAQKVIRAMENQGKYHGAQKGKEDGAAILNSLVGETHRELIKQRHEGGRERSPLRRRRGQCKDSEECGQHAQGRLGGQPG